MLCNCMNMVYDNSILWFKPSLTLLDFLNRHFSSENIKRLQRRMWNVIVRMATSLIQVYFTAVDLSELMEVDRRMFLNTI